jgi:LuxR family maltose regulon positive regulatory protein
MPSHQNNALRPPLLKTKFFIPKPSQATVTRPHLVTVLNQSLQLPLIILSAPAGFGKTTLVGEWITSINLPTTWLSLDYADDDPSCFFSYLIAALQRVNKRIGREIEDVLRSGQLPPVPFITASLINDILAADTPFILVLDDFQVIQDPVILEVLETMLANPPKQLHLVVITREDPLLPLGRLRANNQMAEIRASNLRFSEAEVDRFLNGIMGLDLSEDDIAALEDRTEGWVAGIQLAAIAMCGRSDVSDFISRLRGSHRFILAYLTEEVLTRQSEEIQMFLLQTSILDKLCGELCNAVTGKMNSSSLLEKSFHANLFLIPLDDEGRWYRYHHLFRDLLLSQQHRIPKNDMLQLHRRASQWYQETGMISESIEHALVAADYAHAVQLLEDHARPMIIQGYLKTVESWMQAIPSEWQLHNPRANLAFALMHLLRGNYERVMPYLQQAGQAISDIDTDAEESKPLKAEWLALQANLLNVQGKAEQGIDLANQALQRTGTDDFYVKGLAYAALGGGYRLTSKYASSVEAYQLAIQNSRLSGNLSPEMQSVTGLMVMAIQHGHLHFAYQVGSQTLARLESEGAQSSPVAGIVYAGLGSTCYEWNQLGKAFSFLSQAVHLSSLSGHSGVLIYSKIFLARVFLAQGDSRAAAHTIQEVMNLLLLGITAWLKPEVATNLVRFYLDQGNPVAAETVLKQLDISITADFAPSKPLDIPNPLTNREGLNYLLSLRFLLHQVREGQRESKLEQGIDLAGDLVDSAMSAQLIAIALQALLLRVQMVAFQGDPQASLDSLLQAVELAEPEGYIRIFLDEGSAIAALLRLTLRQPTRLSDRQVHFVQQILASSTAGNAMTSLGEVHSSLAAPDLEENLIEPLTEREMDVLTDF